MEVFSAYFIITKNWIINNGKSTVCLRSLSRSKGKSTAQTTPRQEKETSCEEDHKECER